MTTWRRRTALYLGGTAVSMLVFTVAYHWGMATFEGEPSSWLHSLQVVVETFTTTGFGSDAPWTSPEMNLLVVVMDLTGVALIFLLLPVYIFPLFQEMFSTTLPRAVEREDHVVVCGFSRRDEPLIGELSARDVDAVVVVPDEERGRELVADGHTVVHGDPETAAALRGACVAEARAVVADGGDESNASIVLTARELAPDVQIVSFVEDDANAEYLEYAGADDVISPRQVLGESIAGKVTSAVSTDLDTVEIGEDFEIVELPVQRGSDLDGVTLDDDVFADVTGANVIGAWLDGEFEPGPDPGQSIDHSTVLLVAGSRAALGRLSEYARSAERRHPHERVVVAGHGEVGATVTAAVRGSGTETTVVDVDDGPEVDVVGDATDESTLRRADVANAGAIILALGDDTTTIFAALVARELAPDVQIISRADAVESVPKLFDAGADYVLALSTVSGRMLAGLVLGEDVMSLETNVEIVRTRASRLAGQTLAEADVRARTGATVIAVEREDEVVTDLPPDFRLEAADALVLAGTDESVRAFTELAVDGGRS